LFLRLGFVNSHRRQLKKYNYFIGYNTVHVKIILKSAIPIAK